MKGLSGATLATSIYSGRAPSPSFIPARQPSALEREESDRRVSSKVAERKMDVEKVERKEVEVDDDGRVRTGTTVWALHLLPLRV